MRTLLCLTASLFTSCGAAYELRADRYAYAPGDTIQLTLRNNSDVPCSYNLCFAHFEPAMPGDVRTCNARAYGLEAGSETQFALPLPAQTAAGKYTLNTTISLQGEGEPTDDNLVRLSVPIVIAE